jgi:cell wall-associated NlpC family hydrolase
MNKKFAAIGIATLVLTSCMTGAQARPLEIRTPPTNINIQSKASVPFVNKIITDRQLDARSMTLSKNTKELKAAVRLASENIGKTWYVFSGSTPRGWDCSGLVLWTYGHLGFDLYHSATAQMESGRIVKQPKYGDVVGFSYNGSSRFYHVGIYISEDLMLHSGGKKGDRTELRSISDFAGGYSQVSYSRFIETN